MSNDESQGRDLSRLWRVAPVVLVAVMGVGGTLADAYLRSDAGRYLAEGETLPPVPSALAVVLVLVQAVALWWRGGFPIAVLLVATAVDVALLAVSDGTLGVGTPAVVVAAYTVCRRARGASAYSWLAGAALVSTIVAWRSYTTDTTVPDGWELLFAALRAALVFAVPALVGELVASRARTVLALRERAEAAERERERSAHDAVQAERSLMARELHDIAAHHLSGIIIGAQAAGALVATEPDRAHDYMRTVARDAQHTLANLRQTVGLLRSDDRGDLAPAPSIAQIPQLVAGLRDAGMRIDEEWTGDPVPLGPIAESAAYRMVQESLANARQHAPGAACTVRVDRTAAATTISVTNVRPVARGVSGPLGGHGLIGMRERAALTGAELSVGPTPDGGWRTELRLPPPDPATDASETDASAPDEETSDR